MASEFQTPMIELELMLTDSGACPGRVGQKILQLRHKKLQCSPPCWKGVWNSHDELNVERRFEESAVEKRPRVVQHSRIKDFNFRLNSILEHAPCERFHQLRRVLIDLSRKVNRPRREGGHLWPESDTSATFLLVASTASCGMLDDHSRAMFPH